MNHRRIGNEGGTQTRKKYSVPIQQGVVDPNNRQLGERFRND